MPALVHTRAQRMPAPAPARHAHPGRPRPQFGGQVPRCVACSATSYTDEPNTRLACKPCGAGRVSTANRTACTGLAGVVANATANGTLTAALAGRLDAWGDRVNATITNLTLTVTRRVEALEGAAANATANVTSTGPLGALADRFDAFGDRVNATLRNATAAVARRVDALGDRVNATLANATAALDARVDALAARLNLSDSRGLARLFNASGQEGALWALWRNGTRAPGNGTLPAISNLVRARAWAQPPGPRACSSERPRARRACAVNGGKRHA